MSHWIDYMYVNKTTYLNWKRQQRLLSHTQKISMRHKITTKMPTVVISANAWKICPYTFHYRHYMSSPTYFEQWYIKQGGTLQNDEIKGEQNEWMLQTGTINIFCLSIYKSKTFQWILCHGRYVNKNSINVTCDLFNSLVHLCTR